MTGFYNAVNAVGSAVFGTLLAPFGARHDWMAWVDLVLWSVVFGVIALLVFKYCSAQKAIARTKNEIKVHLLEIRLFKDDILGVLVSTGKILLKNALYIGHNLTPMLVMLLPMVAVLAQLEATYAFDPAPPGRVELFKVAIDTAHADAKTPVRLELPPGVVVEAGPVRTAAGEVAWRLRADEAGDHELKVKVGDVELTKRWVVGGEAGRMPVKRTKSWEALLYPGEGGLPSDAPLSSLELSYPERDLGWMPGGEGGILLTFFVLSLAAGFALKGVLGVTI